MGQNESRSKFKITQDKSNNLVKTAIISDLSRRTESLYREDGDKFNSVPLGLEPVELDSQGDNVASLQSKNLDCKNQSPVSKTRTQLREQNREKELVEEVLREHSNSSPENKYKVHPVTCPIIPPKGQTYEIPPKCPISLPHSQKLEKEPVIFCTSQPQGKRFENQTATSSVQQSHKYEKQCVVFPKSQIQEKTKPAMSPTSQSQGREYEKEPVVFTTSQAEGLKYEREAILAVTNQQQEQKCDKEPFIFASAQSEIQKCKQELVLSNINSSPIQNHENQSVLLSTKQSHGQNDDQKTTLSFTRQLQEQKLEDTNVLLSITCTQGQKIEKDPVIFSTSRPKRPPVVFATNKMQERNFTNAHDISNFSQPQTSKEFSSPIKPQEAESIRVKPEPENITPRKLISSGNPFLQSPTNGKIAKDIFNINQVDDQYSAIPPKTTNVNYSFESQSRIKYTNKRSGMDLQVCSTKGLDVPLHVDNTISMQIGNIGSNINFLAAPEQENTTKNETVKKTLKHVEMIADSLTNSTGNTHPQQMSSKIQFIDSTKNGSQNHMLNNCIVKMKNICHSDKDSVHSLQKELVTNLKHVDLFISVLKTCPVINSDIYSVCENIKSNLSKLKINNKTNDTETIVTESSTSKPEYLSTRKSQNVLKPFREIPRNNANHDNINNFSASNNTVCKIEETSSIKKGFVKSEMKSSSLNPFMTILDQLPDYLTEEKTNISLKNTKLYCRVCDESIDFVCSKLIEHLEGRNHCVRVSSVKMSASVPGRDSPSDSSYPITSPVLNDGCLPNECLTLQELEPVSSTDLPQNYKNVLDLISKSVEDGFAFNVDIFICLECDFLENDNIKALNHVRMVHKDLQSAVWHFCDACRINMYGTNDHFKEHCLTVQHINIAKLKNDRPIEESSKEKCSLDTSSATEDFDRRSVCSSKSDASNKSRSKITPHQILLAIAKDKLDKNIGGPFGLYCQACNYYTDYSKTKTNHFESEKHIRILKEQKFRKKLRCQECSTCQIHLFADNNVWMEHQNHNIHKDLLERNENGGINQHMPETRSHDLPKTSGIDNIESNDRDDIEINMSEPLLSVNGKGPHYDMMKRVLKKRLEKNSDQASFYGFYCHLCQLYSFEEEQWQSHLYDPSHASKVNNPRCFGSKILHDCEICNVRLICDKQFFSLHLQSLAHKAISRIPDRRQAVESENEDGSSEDEYSSENDYESDGHEDNTSLKDDRKGNSSNTNNVEKNTRSALIRVENGIYFQGLPKDSDYKDVSGCFKRFGAIKSCKFDRNQGSGSVIFKNKNDATTVLQKDTIYFRRSKVIVRPLMGRPPVAKQRPVLHPDVVAVMRSWDKIAAMVSCVLDEMAKSYINNQQKGNDIKSDLTATAPGCRILFFGSQVTGLATGRSDFDIFFDIDGKSFYKELNYEQQHKFIQHLQNQMNRPGSKFVVRETILEARVPIIRVVHMRTNTLCDISCRSGLSVENSHLVRLYLESDPRVRWLVVAIKFWMETNGLLDSTIFTSYATVWLVLFFLMRVSPPVICPVTTLQKDCQPRTVAKWDCRFHRDMKDVFRTSNRLSPLELLAAFFQMYSNCPYKRMVLCPLNSWFHTRKQFENCELPREFRPYLDKIQNSAVAERLRLHTPICLEDPFDLAHNITKGVSRADLTKFKTLCKHSHKMCQNLMTR